MNETIEVTARDVEPRALTVVEPHPPSLFGTDDPKGIIRTATVMANELAAVVERKRLFAMISGRKHVTVEGWTLLGSLCGVFPVVEWSRPIENGWEARVEARTLSGAVVGAAEAQCSRSEKTWASRDDYALRSMAQTRATSKALRLPLSFVMTLAGFEGTPADEMPGVEKRMCPVHASNALTRSPKGKWWHRMEDGKPCVPAEAQEPPPEIVEEPEL